jgi:glycosyltransferase involved in cell wall biosynthesis
VKQPPPTGELEPGVGQGEEGQAGIAHGAEPYPRNVAVARIAYLVNQYPKPSHSFIRREILALERQGVAVQRIALRAWAEAAVDPRDADEQARTRYVLAEGIAPLLGALLACCVASPGRFLAALVLAWRLSRRADRGLARHLAYLAEACRILPWLRDGGAAHLHAHFGTNPAAVAALARALGGPPYSFTVHGPEEFDRAPALALGEKASRADFVIAISSHGRSQLYRWLAHADWPKVRVVHCGVDDEFLVRAEAPPAAPRLVCVGRLSEQKGHLLLVEAAARLAARGFAFELVLAGDGESRAAVESLIRRYGLQSRVRITGWVGGNEVRREIEAARALVLPSFAEGLPVVLMEAMALGRPVIATCIAGIPELVRDEKEGWLVAPGSVGELAAAMERALSCPPATLAAMGEAARVRVLARHGVDASAVRLAALFARCAT